MRQETPVIRPLGSGLNEIPCSGYFQPSHYEKHLPHLEHGV